MPTIRKTREAETEKRKRVPLLQTTLKPSDNGLFQQATLYTPAAGVTQRNKLTHSTLQRVYVD